MSADHVAHFLDVLPRHTILLFAARLNVRTGGERSSGDPSIRLVGGTPQPQ